MDQKAETAPVRLGIDVGSTTVKVVALDACGNVLFRRYRRHHAKLAESACDLAGEALAALGDVPVRVRVCGSGGHPIAEALGAAYVQEVVANALAVGALYPEARCAIELGGQDAKVVFFEPDERTGHLRATDMRMNGSCAGGTGAFVDEVAVLLDASDTGLEALASRGHTVHEVSGRCGVFAKTDIQPLRLRGVSREDLALSAFHAIAKQTIGGLAQGLELAPPIVFEGGPLTYNPTLVRVFAERLKLSDVEVIVPDHPETMVTYGAAVADAIDTPRNEGRAATLAAVVDALDARARAPRTRGRVRRPLFASDEERAAFACRHAAEAGVLAPVPDDGTAVVRAYVGVDSGSTTSKVVLVNEEGALFDSFYRHNDGEPIRAVREGLLELEGRYRARGMRLEVLGLATTGYGEKMMASALGADCSLVETVAHAHAAVACRPDVSFVLDIGGQDMKALWIDRGVVTDIVLNEACSSGCGSFLENFALGLGVEVEDLAEVAFSSEAPAELGSRCTVFMTSTVITEQRAGASPADITAGLCRSVVENVFTKVVRLNDASELGGCVMAQGGTFRNDAVLRALEEYLGRDVVRAPFPGEMGAIGAALEARDHARSKGGAPSTFIGFDELRSLTYTQESGVACTRCANACSRTVTSFSTGARYVTGNKCARGAVADEADSTEGHTRGTDLHAWRAQALFKRYPVEAVRPQQREAIGLPRVLEFWDSMPFWSTFLRALGHEVRFSSPSSAALLESGLRYVASDTVCLPAKLVHGHVLDLCRKGVDRVLLPYIMHLPPEGQDKQSPYACAIVMGYPMVVRNFQDPEDSWGVTFDQPVFHWFTEEDRRRQVCAWAEEALHAEPEQAERAFDQGARALAAFREELVARGEAVLEGVAERGERAVVLAGRPYHSDPFVSHGVSRALSEAGVSVLTCDSLPGLSDVPLENLLPEVTNNFHTRVLESALIAAATPGLELVQLVSFGCGHDAILSDEVTRILSEAGGKRPLILKLDESDATGSVGIRLQSFMETSGLSVRPGAPERPRGGDAGPQALPNPYRVSFEKADRGEKTLLVPNISREVSLILRGALRGCGYRAEVVPVGGPAQMKLGKRYTHNDICFPCQMVIGEVIDALQSGAWDPDEVAVGMVKFKCDCRMSHYAALLRRALDRAGFEQVPILTTDPVDTKGMHPGVALLGPKAVFRAVWAAMMLDVLQELKRKTQPYELHAGETERVFNRGVDEISAALEQGLRPAVAAYKRTVAALAEVPFDRSDPKPRVFVTGELLVTYHEGSNFHMEEWLMAHGREAVFPRVTDQLRKDFICAMAEITDFDADISKESFPVTALFDLAQASMERIARAHPLFKHDPSPAKLYEGVADIVPKTLSCGEGWLMAAEIEHFAQEGVRSFIVLQPFGCLPNHVCGRGVTKRLKDRHPGIQILPIDLDPDTSFANVENRLQMLLMGEEA